MEPLSDDELHTNVFSDTALFLDTEDDDESVGSPQVPTPATSTNHEEQQRHMLASSLSGRSGAGVQRLDLSVLSNILNAPNLATADYPPSGTAYAPLSFSREAEQDYHNGYVMTNSAHSINSIPSPQHPSQSLPSFNVYSSIAAPPLCARKLSFRDFLHKKTVSPHIDNEESTGIFVGQLPSSYAEGDIEALLKAIGYEKGKEVQVRDVKCHNRDRTCAFIMINAGALSSILDFTKRVLCDVNCVWVVEPYQAADLPLFVQQMPREQLRGVPKAALVLEKLTPQSKLRNPRHNPAVGSAFNVPSNAMLTSMANPIQPNMVNMLPYPLFLQQQQQQQQQQGEGGPAAVAAAPGYLDVSALQLPPAFIGNTVAQPTIGNGLPTFFGPHGGAPSNASSSTTLLAPCSFAQSPSSVYTAPFTGSGIGSIEATNQMLLAASRTATTSGSHYSSNMGPLTPCDKEGCYAAPNPSAVTLQPALPSEHCSCGQLLLLSQHPEQGGCAKCQSTIMPYDIAYWCLAGHLAVCASCAIKSNTSHDIRRGNGRRFSTESSSQLADLGLTSRVMN